MVAPIDKLERVEVPGLAALLERQSALRDRAFLPVETTIAGIPVRPFCLRHLHALDAVKNGFVVPCIYERPSEKVAHALQFMGFVSNLCDIEDGPFFGLRLWWRRRQAQRFIARALRENAGAIFAGIERYLEEAFWDCPEGKPGKERQVTDASFMAQLVDDFCAAGHRFTEQELFNLPMVRLWQYWRLAVKRRVQASDPGFKLPNRSDQLIDRTIAALNAARAAAAAQPKKGLDA